MRLLTAVLEERISFSWEGVREKKAVSDAEAAAEHIKSTRIANKPAINPAEEARLAVMGLNSISAFNASGSGSATV